MSKTKTENPKPQGKSGLFASLASRFRERAIKPLHDLQDAACRVARGEAADPEAIGQMLETADVGPDEFLQIVTAEEKRLRLATVAAEFPKLDAELRAVGAEVEKLAGERATMLASYKAKLEALGERQRDLAGRAAKAQAARDELVRQPAPTYATQRAESQNAVRRLQLRDENERLAEELTGREKSAVNNIAMIEQQLAKKRREAVGFPGASPMTIAARKAIPGIERQLAEAQATLTAVHERRAAIKAELAELENESRQIDAAKCCV